MNKGLFKAFSLITILALVLAAMPMQDVQALGGGSGVISLSALGNTYAQSFDTLATAGTTNNLAITGWFLDETGTSAANNGQYAAGTGSSTAGDTYSFGLTPITDRAFGGLQSGTLIPTIGASFTNNTGATITSLAISYTGEQWRAGVANRGAADRIDFELSTNATSLTTGTWADYDNLDFNSPNINTAVGALNGNGSGNRTIINSGITCLNIPNGAAFWIRWVDFNISSSDDGLAVDDFSLTPNGVAGDPAPSVCSTVPTNGAVGVALNANLTVNFTEPVNVSDTWYDIACTSSGAHTAVVSGGPISFTLNPDADFAYSESCTVTVLASLVTDQDANDPPDNMDANFSWSFTTASPPLPSPMIINEVDSDTPGTDTAEFVELYDGGLGNTDLSGLVVVFYNGNGDVSYAAFDLDTKATNASGYFLLGNSAVTPNIVFGNGVLQNGPDAVALYRGDATDFPDGSAVTVFNLIDALVYGSGAADAGLLPLLNVGQLQVDEDAAHNVTGHSNQRCPNGAGGQRNTDTYLQNTPSSGAANNCGIPATIMQIQDTAHRSPLAGQLVRDVPGIVTALRSNGFYMQDAFGDGNPATSDGIFVFSGSAPSVSVGDALLVRGYVSEFRQSSSSSPNPNLTVTEIDLPSITIQSNSNPLPALVIIGTGGRVPPTTVIDDDATGDVETSGSFDFTTDGIDFYESLEGMRVQINDAVVTGPRRDFGSNREVPIIGDNGTNAGVRTTRGGIVIQANDFNPERIILNDLIVGGPTLPSVNVRDRFPGATIGVMDYNFGNFKLEVTSLPAMVSGNLDQEVITTPAGTNQLAIATFNVENLDPGDGATKFNTLAGLIVTNLKSPDVIAIEEIQDNNGEADTGNVDASTTWGMLITAIQGAGGPTYDYRQIDPVNDQDGGAPGGNIRQGFLFRTDRGLSFIDRPGAGSTTANSVSGSGAGTQLQYSPGRIDPANAAFNSSRKPLAGEFMFNGDHLFVIANHFNSKGGDDPLYGHIQPPVRSSETQRHQQAQIVHDFVADIVTADPNADVVVLGDLNDFQFSDTVTILKGALLNTLMDKLPLNEQYSYDFEGNSQAIDHTLFSNHLFATRPFTYDVVHVNSEFAAQASDHEPQVVRVTVDNSPPDTTITVNPSNPTNDNNASFTFTGTDDVTAPTSLTFECDLDGGGFSGCTSPQSYTGLADGSHTFQVRAKDGAGNVDPSPASFTWVIDTTPPDTTIDSSPTDPSNSSSASFSFSGTDSGTGVANFECDLDGGGFSACTSPKSYSSLSDGSHTFQVRAIDAVSNVDQTPASFTWTIDTTAPNATIDSNPSNPSNSNSASFSFSGTDSGTGVASFECKLDGGSFATCTSPQNYSSLSDGSHTFQVRAVDGVGNVDPTPASFTWVIDTTAPDTTITTNPANPSNSSSASFTFTGNDGSGTGVASFECKLDGGSFGSCTSPQSYSSLADGSHTFQVRAIDGVGNVDPTPASFTWKIDTVAPTISVAAGGMCASSGGTMNLTVADSSGSPLTLSGNSSNATAVPNANIVFGGSGSSRTVTITAVSGSTVRTATLTITVSDGVNTASTTITVTVGTSGNNTALNGTSGADLILGLDGNDTLNGLNGNDLLCGGAKNDILNGGNNDDTLRGEAGNDSLTGGANADFFSGGTGNDTNTDFNAGQGDTNDGT